MRRNINSLGKLPPSVCMIAVYILGFCMVGCNQQPSSPEHMRPDNSISEQKPKVEAISLESQVPPETQLLQLQAEINKVDHDIKKNLGKLAAQEVEAERLESNLTKMKENQTALREEITGMIKALDSKEEKPTYNGKQYARSELALQLEAKVNTYELRKTEIKTREQLLTAKRMSLDMAHNQIGELRKQKETLRAATVKLEAIIETGKLKTGERPILDDESLMKKCQELADKLDRQLVEEEKKAELYEKYGYTEKKPPVRQEKPSPEDVLKAAKKALQDEDKVAPDKK